MQTHRGANETAAGGTPHPDYLEPATVGADYEYGTNAAGSSHGEVEGSYAPVYAIYSGNAGSSAAATSTTLAINEQNYVLDTTANLAANSSNT